MDLAAAVQKHAEWKVKFRTAINKKEKLDAVQIGRDDCCEVGKWLHGEGKMRYSQLPSFQQCMTLHATFHGEAGKVAQTINAQEYAKAEAMLGSDSYSSASTKLGVTLQRLKLDAKL